MPGYGCRCIDEVKCYIGNLDGTHEGLVIANSQKAAAQIAGTPYLAGISDLGGRKKYRDLYAKEVASRIEEQSQRFEALESTVKTLNGMAQLAMQQISVLNKELTSLKALPAPSDDGSDSVETEVKGE